MHEPPELKVALEELAEMARSRRPDDALLAEFLPRYYHELPSSDVDDRKLDDVYAVAAAHLDLGRVRPPGQTLVKVVSPERERDGWRSSRSMLFVVTDDVPFLVDTIRMVLDRHGLGIHLIVHPMLAVERDAAHQVAGWGRGDDIEAWTQIEIDRCDGPQAAALETEVAGAIGEVHHVVAEFPAMRDRISALAPLDPLIGWLARDHFVFLGAADYTRTGDGGLELVAGSGLGQLADGARTDPPSSPSDDVLVVSRTDAEATIHRPERQVCLQIRPPGAGVEHRFVGLLGATAFRTSVFDIPTVGERARAVFDLSEADPESYLGRAVRNVLETLPRELLFELDEHTLAELVIEIVGLQERQLVRVLEVPEPVGPWRSVMVFLPRNRFTGTLPEQVARLVSDGYGGEYRNLESKLGHSSLARISMTVRRPADRPPPDLTELGQQVDAMSTSWADRLLESLIDDLGEAAGQRLFEQVGRHAPAAYRGTVAAHRAIDDLERVAALLRRSPGDFTSALVTDIDAPQREWRFKVYRRDLPIALSEILPLLDHLGLIALDERPYEFRTADGDVFLYDMRVLSAPEVAIDDSARAELHHAFAALMNGEVEGDRLNRLILHAGLTTHDVAVLRSYSRYLRQTGFSFSQQYIEETLVRHAAIARLLVALFQARFDPSLGAADGDGRSGRLDSVRAELATALDAVPSLDDDRICRAFCQLIEATDRTNAWRRRGAITLKLDPARIPDLPEPRPAHEIWVCSPEVEGVHLRGGRVARGGLRWSDRREDFRTEVLGLMKAQMVKNAVIVPVGAKGGFVVKRPPADPAQLRMVGVECYKMFVRGMLDVTDNIERGEVVHPPDTVCHDREDTYLVVAADKGTATFSDIANDVAAEYGYWLGDAFASGGSAGYDHKAMGITARGAWESVRRHASVLGRDAERDVLTVVGIGDMSGDVFGNGMLRSSNLKLIAAFDHRDIFIDPDPHPDDSFTERQRLYDMERSSWQDYDRTLISQGGGVYSRQLKSITLSPEARQALDAPEGPLTPHEVISAILRAPVDLLWNGGIGTYIKSRSESHDEVGDRANDAVRIDGDDVRARMIAEGGNLGVTQLGRVEYALNGGLIYTDAIDNSAGVTCSDYEVNIKILLNQLVADEELTVKQRNVLLEAMTDEVADKVLDHNQAQTLALMLARRQTLQMANVHARYLDALESEGWIDRELEHLPTDKQIAERQVIGSGLRTPEFAVLMAYTKNGNVVEVLDSDLPDDPALERDLFQYFPTLLRERYPDAIRQHRLRRQIVATELVNQVTNLSGISFDHRMIEDTGSGVAEVIRAWVTARDSLDFAPLWAQVEDLGSSVPLDVRAELFLDCRRMNERGTLWLLRHRHPPFDVSVAVDHFRPGLRALAGGLSQAIGGRMAEVVQAAEASRLAAGVPESLAEQSSVWRLMHTGFDLVDLVADCAREGRSATVLDAATIYWDVFDRLELMWIWDGIGALPRSNRWQTQARSALRDDLLGALAGLTRSVVRSAEASVDAWMERNHRSVARSKAMFTEIRRTETYDVTNLCVAVRQLRNLALTAVDVTAANPADPVPA